MRLVRPALLPVLVLALGLTEAASVSAARPLPAERLPALAATVEPEMLVRLAERRGVDRILEPADRLALLNAGLPQDIVDRLMQLALPSVEVDGVSYARVHGVLRVRSDESELATSEIRDVSGDVATVQPPSDRAEPEAHDTWPPQEASTNHVGSEAAMVGEESHVMGGANPYPAGAYGLAGAVFVPARFGDRPSAFGRTIVSAVTPVAGVCRWDATCVAGRMPVLAGPQRVSDARTDGFIPFRTSRGILWVPN